MGEVTSRSSPITLVLCAVFVPIAFISGLTVILPPVRAHHRLLDGHLGFNSLTLSPALAAILLKSPMRRRIG